MFGGNVELEVDRLLPPKSRRNRVILAGLEAVSFGLYGVESGLELGKTEPSRIVRLHRSLQAVLGAHDCDNGARDGRSRRIGYGAGDGAGGFALRECGHGNGPGRESERYPEIRHT